MHSNMVSVSDGNDVSVGINMEQDCSHWSSQFVSGVLMDAHYSIGVEYPDMRMSSTAIPQPNASQLI
jgi:hypothetical protein